MAEKPEKTESEERLELIAIASPKPEKVERAIQLLKDLAEKVFQNEPGVLRYTIHKELNLMPGQEGVDVIMVEEYADQSVQQAHLESEYFKEFARTLGEEELLRGPLVTKMVKRMGGFVR